MTAIGIALITGASAGIGKELAGLFAADGYDLILTGRSGGALEAIKKDLEASHGISVQTIALDLAQPGAARTLADAVSARGSPVTILVNNAGVGAYGEFADIPWDTHARMLQLNVHALTELTALILPDMIKCKQGRILNVASTAAFQAGPLMAVYYATKAYVLSFSEGLRQEVKNKGVTVTCLCPGPTRTNFAKEANLGGSKLFRSLTMDAQRVAHEGYWACMRGKPLVIPGLRNKILAFCTRLVPRSLAARVAFYAQRKV